MEKNRKQKLFIIFALFFVIASLSVGFAAFSTTLNIASSANVSPNADTFSVKFSTNKDSLVENSIIPLDKTTGLDAKSAVIDNAFNPRISGLSATFTAPGQYVEYVFYARNEGEYTAYLNSINFIGEKECRGSADTSDSLVQSACASIDISVTFSGTVYNSTSSVSNHPLEKNKGEQIKIRLEYSLDGVLADGAFSIEFPDIVFIYSTINDENYYPSDFGSFENESSLYSVVRAKASKSDVGVNFKDVSVNGVYVNNETEDDFYPIYYYRGSVTDNHVFFADKCWLIVRTTDTGGVKLIYNGTMVDGVCGSTISDISYAEYNTVTGNDNAVKYFHSNGTNSTKKESVDSWYENNLINYSSYLEDTPWCQEMTTFDHNSEFGSLPSSFVSDNVYYAASKRIYNGTPTFSCDAENQLMVNTPISSNKIEYPIGLITVDEAIFAGLGSSDYSYFSNYSYIVNWGGWCTMTPAYYNPSTGKYFFYTFYLDGQISAELTSSGYETRPVISVHNDVEVVSGNGNADNPYIIKKE